MIVECVVCGYRCKPHIEQGFDYILITWSDEMKKHEREHMRSMVWRIISEKDDVLRRILDLSKLKENSSWDLIFEIFGKKEK